MASPADTKASDTPETAGVGETGDADLTTKIFQFLATATPGTLGGVAVGLAAVTYLILGQIGLLLIGAFAGVVGFIQWEQRNAEVARAIRGETGHDVLARLLEVQKSLTSQKDDDGEDGALTRTTGFEDFRPETREALNALVDAVIADYVKWWYSPIVPSDKFFPLACRKTLVSFITAISNHLSRKRPADAFLDFVTNSSSIVIVFFSELSKVFEGLPSDSNMSAADAVYGYLASHPDSNLANLLNQRQQAGKFRMVAEDLLAFLERQTYECDPARVFLREILAATILETTLQKCSKAEYINSWIVYLLEAGEPDFSQAIDVGMQTGPGADVVFADLDGNVGNIGLTKGNRNSLDQERARRKEAMHKKKLSKAEEEMEAMEEVKRLNQMIADEDARRSKTSLVSEPAPPAAAGEDVASASAADASERLASALKRNVDEYEIQNPAETQISAQSDGSSSSKNEIHTPLTPLSTHESIQESSPPPPPSNRSSQFTSFDQIVPHAADADDDEEPPKPPPMTLYQATITVLDEPGGRIKTKPTWDYLVQIEPATTLYPGWMIVRKYSDFERLHEVLRRIATISGVTTFTETHGTLPAWKAHSRTTLREALEKYLRDACWSSSLAESEGMKKFLERDNVPTAGGPKLGFQAFEKIGKNVFDVLTSAPVEGSKAVVGGVTGVLGNIGIGQRKPAPAPSPTPPPPLQDVTAASRLSISSLPRADSTVSLNGRKTRDSTDSQRSSVIATQPAMVPPMDRRPSYNSLVGEAEPDGVRRSRASARNSRDNSRASSLAPQSPLDLSLGGLRLPPPPDLMGDDYESPISPLNQRQDHPSHTRSLTMPTLGTHTPPPPPLSGQKLSKQHSKLSEQETRVAVELLFAVINELYTLSSAWNIRRTLLAAAKSFLLRPGNPSLLSIQSMLQSSVLDANTSDAGMAAHLRKLRENTLPTEAELATWPAELTAEEKEKLRVKARRLLIESGVPAALMGVMGQAATGDALGRLFDCLQVEEVARGLVFGVMLQGVRGVTH
ncbi:PXA domain-containing protein [Echria macrotheca]|uniref:PXA domain-containing protein n=1 Tax=Echria macrotheca TaxID=438768 RepID=A0AAJ0B5Y3_9PEZI|nr:PXA domain-containing protein [Echria macrotheca]